MNNERAAPWRIGGDTMKTRKSWREKLADNKGLPKVGKITGRMTVRWGTGTRVIPAPKEVDAIMKRVPRGKLVTINEIRARLAKRHKVSMACPITTGIFAWIAAHAAEEAAAAGIGNVTPYWRRLKAAGNSTKNIPVEFPGSKSFCKRKGIQWSRKAAATGSLTLNNPWSEQPMNRSETNEKERTLWKKKFYSSSSSRPGRRFPPKKLANDSTANNTGRIPTGRGRYWRDCCSRSAFPRTPVVTTFSK